MFKAFKKVITKATVKAIKHLPEIMFVGGVITFGATVYMSHKAGPKILDVIKEHNESLEECKKAAADPEVDYTEDDCQKDIRYYYRNTFFRVAKIALPTIAMGTLSIGLFGGAQYIVMRRLGALSAEYVVLDKTFKQYRENVISEEGEEKDRQYMYGVKKVKKTVPVLDEEGSQTEVETEEEIANDPGYFFTWSKETAPGLFQDVEIYNDHILNGKAAEIGRLKKEKGLVTDNDILNILGMNKQIRMNPLLTMQFGQYAKDENDDHFEFKINKIWVPDYEKGKGTRLIYKLGYDREIL